MNITGATLASFWRNKPVDGDSLQSTTTGGADELPADH
jgi:hypothetical protein